MLQGAGAWFSYGRQAETAVASGVGLVHLDPTAVREIGIVARAEPRDKAQAFVGIARAETATMLLPTGHPVLEHATWISGADVLGFGPGDDGAVDAVTAALTHGGTRLCCRCPRDRRC